MINKERSKQSKVGKQYVKDKSLVSGPLRIASSTVLPSGPLHYKFYNQSMKKLPHFLRGKSGNVAYCNICAASYMVRVSVVVLSIPKIKSPGETPALFAGPPGAADITTSPDGDPSDAAG